MIEIIRPIVLVFNLTKRELKNNRRISLLELGIRGAISGWFLKFGRLDVIVDPIFSFPSDPSAKTLDVPVAVIVEDWYIQGDEADREALGRKIAEEVQLLPGNENRSVKVLVRRLHEGEGSHYTA